VNSSLPLKIDFHIHTIYSYDGLITPKQLVWQLKKRRLDGVAITDHDTIKGWPKFERALIKHGFIAIPGVEVSAKGAHILALNVKSSIPAGHEIDETIDFIHEAGGIAVAAHPVAIYRGWARKLCGKFDAIEVVNASSFPFYFSAFFGKRLAMRLKLPQLAGSDAHYYKEVGSAYTILKTNDPNLEGVLRAIKRGATIPCGSPIPLRIRLKREALTIKKRLG